MVTKDSRHLDCETTQVDINSTYVGGQPKTLSVHICCFMKPYSCTCKVFRQPQQLR